MAAVNSSGIADLNLASSNAGRRRALARVAAMSAMGVMLASSGVLAVDGQWSALSGTYEDTNNWVGGIVADGSGATATFNADLNGNATVTAGASHTLGVVTFGDTAPATAGNWTLGLGTNVLTVDGTAPAFNINADTAITGTATNSLVINGTTPVLKTGTGLLDLTGTTWSGTAGWNLQGGTVRSNLTTTQTIAVATRGPLSGSGTYELNPTNVNFTTTFDADLSAFTGTLRFIGANNANIRFGASSSVPAAAITDGLKNATLDLGTASSNFFYRNGTSGTITIRVGALTGGFNTFVSGGSTAGGGQVVFEIGNKNVDSTYTGTFRDGLTKTALTKVGTAKFTLNGQNRFSGTTNVNAGTLEIGGDSTAFTDTTPVVVNSGGKLAVTGQALLNVPSITVNTGGTFDVSGESGYHTAAGFNAVTATAGQTLQGTGTIVGNYLHDQGTLNAATVTTAGTLTFANNLSITGGTVNLEVSPNSTIGGTNDLLSVAGTTTLGGNATLNLGIIGGASSASYVLINSPGGLSGSTSGWTVGFAARGAAPTLTQTATQLIANITAANAGSLTWTAAANSNWDVKTSQDWKLGATPDVFYQLDAVRFDDTAASSAVVLNAAVAPSAVVVDNSTLAYSITGTGSINGSATLTKRGTNTLTLGTTNTYTGGTRIEAGVLDVGAFDTAIGSGTLTLAGGTFRSTKGNANYAMANNIAVEAGTASTLELNTGGATARQFSQFGTMTGSGTLNVTSTDTAVTKGIDFTGDTSGFSGTLNLGGNANYRFGLPAVGNPSLILNLASTARLGSISNGVKVVQIGQLTGSGTIQGHQSSGNGSTVEYQIGSLNTSSTFDGQIVDGAQAATVKPVLVTKVGTGSLTLTAANTYTGATTVKAGTLILSSAAAGPVLGNATVTAPGGADIQGGKLALSYVGGTSRAPEVQSILTAGYGEATPFATGLLRSTTLASGRVLGWADNTAASQVEVAYTRPGDADLNFTVAFSDLLTLAKNYGATSGKVWAQGDFDYNGSVGFTDLLLLAKNYGQAVTASESAQLSPAFAADFAAAQSLVPEPATLSALGLGAVAMIRRRRA